MLDALQGKNNFGNSRQECSEQRIRDSIGDRDDNDKDQEKVKTALSLSDKLNQENLLRFYVPNGFETIDPKKYDYKNEAERNEAIEKQKGEHSTSVFSKNGNKTTTNLYPVTRTDVEQQKNNQ